jgi:hypothetical protein
MTRGERRGPLRLRPVYDRAARARSPYTRDETGRSLYQAVRFENPKTFRQRRVLPDGTTPWGLDGVRLVLYRLPELLAADPALTVFVVEGEKDADRLIDAGLIATTSVMGAGKWRPSTPRLLKGRHVVVIPDNDRPGREHADAVVASLLGVAASVRLMPLDVPRRATCPTGSTPATPATSWRSGPPRSSRWASHAPSTRSARSPS